MKLIASYIAQVLRNYEDEGEIARIKAEVTLLCHRHSIHQVS